MSIASGEDTTPVPQPVLAPLTSSAIFLVARIKPDRECYAAVRSLCADLPGIFRAVDFRRIEAGLSCVAGFGSDAWDKLFQKRRPAELHPFREIKSGNAMLYRRRLMCCFTSAPKEWICVSNWL